MRRRTRSARLDPASATPLWSQLRDALRERVEAGEWDEGEMIPRELDLCAAYDVSRITAARALQELVREGLLIRRRGRGTAIATRRPTGPARALAFLTPRFEGDWTLDVYGGFESVAAEAGCYALLTSTGGEPFLTAERIRTLLNGHARGLAVSHLLLDEAARALLPELRRDGVPLVFVGTHDPGVDCDRVVADNQRAGEIAVSHLGRLGHSRIVFLGPSEAALERNSALRGRLRGFRAAARRLHRASEIDGSDEGAVLLDALPAGVSERERAERLLAFLERSGATAAVAGTDALAVLVIRYLIAAGLRVPDHLALVGISDTRLAAVAEVPLTTVRISAAALGANAARLLLRRLEGDVSPPIEKVVPVELVVRASCGARSGEDAAEPYDVAARDVALALEAALER